MSKQLTKGSKITRRTALKGIGAGASLALSPGFVRYVQAHTSEPIKIGAPIHRTGIGSSYGRWFEQVTKATVALINKEGGINGHPIELFIEDDGTDPKRGTEVVEKFGTQYKVDVICNHLFSHVVVACAPRVKELKIPYLVTTEGTQIPAGALNRYVFQAGITDVRAQVTAMAPWVLANLGKKATVIYPDILFGHDHRDFFSAAFKANGGTVLQLIPIPATETSFTRYLPKIPSSTDVIYHIMVGPAVLTFVKELGQHLGSKKPGLFGFIDSIEAVDLSTPQLSFLENTYFWEGYPRYAQADQTEFDKFYRKAVGVDDKGASISDARDITTYSHMFACWETLFIIKQAMEMCDYHGKEKTAAFIEALESIQGFKESREHPQGEKVFNAKTHQSFGHQFISKVEKSRLKVVKKTEIKDGYYPDQTDYTKMSL
jgi:branched-chain amino acid transport system substrate-binding protein